MNDIEVQSQQQHGTARPEHLLFVQGQMADRALFSLGQTAFAGEGILWNLEKRGEVVNLDRRLGLRARRHHQKAPESHSHPVRNATDCVPQPVREDPSGYSTFAYSAGHA